MTKKRKAFTSLSRRQRRSKTQQVKNLIYRERHRCGGVFFDECDMEYASNSGGSADVFLDLQEIIHAFI